MTPSTVLTRAEALHPTGDGGDARDTGHGQRTIRRLLDRLDQVGAFGINLLEFCYPMGA